jgi:hypothetical protein
MIPALGFRPRLEYAHLAFRFGRTGVCAVIRAHIGSSSHGNSDAGPRRRGIRVRSASIFHVSDASFRLRIQNELKWGLTKQTSLVEIHNQVD